MSRKDKEILIVGAGPVGLTAACELYRHGTPCRIIDFAPRHNNSKAFALHARTLETFSRMGICDEIISFGKKITTANFFSDNRQFISTDFSRLETPFPFLLAIPQNMVEQTLEKLLIKLGGKVERGVKLDAITVSDEGAEVRLIHEDLKEELLAPRWVLACDGAKSTVRKQLNIPFEGNSYHHGFIVADARIRWSQLKQEANTYLTNKGYLMLIPFPKDGYYRMVLDCAVDEEKKMPSLEEVIEIKNSYGFTDLEVSDPIWISKTNVQKRMVPSFRKGPVFLAGDAAHVHSPVGGQGLNTGIQDAHNLAWKIAYVNKGQCYSSLLDSYHAERYPVVHAVLKRTDLMDKVLSVKNPLLKYLRDTIYGYFTSRKMVKNKIARIASGLDYKYLDSPAVREDTAGNSLNRKCRKAGESTPDIAWILEHNEQVQALSKQLNGPQHLLLLFGGVGPTDGNYFQMKTMAKKISKRFNAQLNVYLILSGDSSAYLKDLSLNYLCDPSGKVHATFGVEGRNIFLVRPDGVIAYCSDSFSLDNLNGYLETIFVEVSLPVIVQDEILEQIPHVHEK